MFTGFRPPDAPAKAQSPPFVITLLVLVSLAFRGQAQVCNDQSYAPLGPNCTLLVLPDMVLENPAPGQTYTLTLTNASGQPVPNPVGPAQLGQTLTVTVTGSGGNSCQGLLTIEDKLAPQISCSNLTVPCALVDYSPAYLFGTLNLANAYPTVSDNCGPFTLTYIDTWTDLGCGGTPDNSAFVRRDWKAVDPSGNTATCAQYIYFDRLHIPDLVFPPNVTVSCTNPQTAPAQTGVPSFSAFGQTFGLFPGTSFCELAVDYSDQTMEVCDGTTMIARTWTVFDWCAQFGFENPYEHVQVITIADAQGPLFECPADTVLITAPLQCSLNFDLPDVLATDHCSRLKSARADWTLPSGAMASVAGSFGNFPGNNLWDPDTLAIMGVAPNLPVGTTTIRYTLTDDCGNSASCTFSVKVIDSIPPVASCQLVTQVTLGINGMALTNAASFNSGSFDFCSPIFFKARRLAANDCQSNQYFHDQVKFCCDDVGDTVDVILRVYDVPVLPDTVGLDYQLGHSNECLVRVVVDDKFKPICVPPPDMSVNCENFDPGLTNYGIAEGFDNCCMDTVLITGLNYALFDTLCNRGTITRSFEAVDCLGNSSTCQQKIVVAYVQHFSIKFPDDLLVFTCDTTGNYPPGPEVFGADCESIGISYEDSPFQATPGACYKVERTWQVIDWCTYDSNLPLTFVPNPTVSNEHNSPLNLPGPTVAPLGGTPPPTVTPISPNTAPVNYSIFWSATSNGYLYKQVITVLDGELPKIRSCPLLNPIPICDKSPNDPHFWNASYYNDPLIPGSHDLCEAYVDLALSANDACTGGNVNIRFLLFLDLDNDGVQETVINSNDLPPPNTVYFGNALLPDYQGGTPYQFDQRPVPPEQKYGFTIQIVPSFFRSARVRWHTLESPETYVQPQLPHGLHRILWIVEDGCGNEDYCDYGLLVEDCKAPTVVCHNGLSVNIMPSGSITLWSNDFLLYAEDNCTPGNLLRYSMRKPNGDIDFPLDANGDPVLSLTFDCNELGSQPVEIWAQDAAGNSSLCQTYVIVQDPFGYCLPPAPLSVAGLIQTEPQDNNEGVDEVWVQFNGVPPGQSPIVANDLTDNNGLYLYGGIVPIGTDYTVTPGKDDNPMNGVSTFDLVLMSKHILGLTPLASPYKMIAADVNKSNSVTTFDILELRKLILGIYVDLPQNTSWRFIDRAFVFAQADNPFASAPFPEHISIEDAQETWSNLDFVGIKIGDVDNSVIANLNGGGNERGGNDPVLFELADRMVSAGEVFEVTLSPREAVAGYQFTLLYDHLTLLDVLPGAGLSADHFGIFPDALTVAAETGAGKGFTLRFKALREGRVRDLLRLSNSITPAEAYLGDTATGLTVKPLALRFDHPEGPSTAGIGFEVYQNQPNPFAGRTRIGFYLPGDAGATLTVFDQTGRVVAKQTADFSAGLNYFILERPAEGPLAYRIDTPFGSATRSMLSLR